MRSELYSYCFYHIWDVEQSQFSSVMYPTVLAFLVAISTFQHEYYDALEIIKDLYKLSNRHGLLSNKKDNNVAFAKTVNIESSELYIRIIWQ